MRTKNGKMQAVIAMDYDYNGETKTEIIAEFKCRMDASICAKALNEKIGGIENHLHFYILDFTFVKLNKNHFIK